MKSSLNRVEVSYYSLAKFLKPFCCLKNRNTMKSTFLSPVIVFLLFSFLCSKVFSQDDNPMEPTPSIGFLKLENGNSYFGHIELGKMSGIGTQFLSNGKHRTGYFQDNRYLGDFIVTPPWHMIDIDLWLEEEQVMETFSIDVNILSDIPDSVQIYIAPFGTSTINGVQFYGGIQTQCGGYNSVANNENVGPFKLLGRSMIFSRWGSRSEDAFIKAKGGLCESSGYEGDFVSVRNALQWKKGKYTFTLRKTDQTIWLDSATHTYVEMVVYDHQTKKNHSCGSLAFPGKTLVLGHENYMFFELYGKRLNVNELTPYTFVCDNMLVNGKQVNYTFVASSFDKKFPIYADAKFSDGKFTVEVGRPNTKPITEGKDFNFNILYSNE